MLAEIQEYLQWSDDVNASESDSVDALHANFKRRVAARLKQSVIPFERVPKMQRIQILHLDASLLLVSVFNVLFWVPAICTVLLHR